MNNKIQLCATMSEDQEYVISGSENGNIYIWNTVNKYIPTINPVYCCFSFSENTIAKTLCRFTGYNTDHNESVEYFRPFNGLAVTNAQFAPISVVSRVAKYVEVPELGEKLKNIIVACSYDGLIQIYYQMSSSFCKYMD